MIDDPHERTRAILWLLADVDPDMPVLSALGHLKAIEARLDLMEAERQKQREARLPKRGRYAGTDGVINLVRDFAGHPVVSDHAKRGDRAAVATELAAHTGCGATEAINAAETLVSTLGGGGMPEPPGSSSSDPWMI